MWAFVLTFVWPLVPAFVPLGGTETTKRKKSKIFFRYAVVLLYLALCANILLTFFRDSGASVWSKLVGSTEYALKYSAMMALLTAIATGFLWIVEGGKQGKFGCLRDILARIADGRFRLILEKYVGPVFFWALAALVVGLNVGMMFDNVLWGDEAFSANTSKASMYGIMQILYYWDNHPPLYYYWLKLFCDVFGHTVPVMHAASLTVFVLGIVFALTLFRKRFGMLPAAIFVMISGLGTECLTYNLEVRMYAIAFLCVGMTFYNSYRVLSAGRWSAWVGMVLWALVGAYSHYYALVAVGIMLFFTGIAVWWKERGKAWRKGVLAIAMFLVGYAPWMYFLALGLRNVSGNWWMSEILGLDEALEIVFCGHRMHHLIFALVIAMIVTLLSVDRKSDETLAILVGTLTIAGTLIFAYGISFLMSPMIARRYMYPLSAVTILMLVIGSSRLLTILREREAGGAWRGIEFLGRIALVLVLAILFWRGMVNYQSTRATYLEQKTKTDETLSLIGTPDAETELVTNGVKHLGWTVLSFYYPDNTIVNGNYNESTANCFWYFNPSELSQEEIDGICARGWSVEEYGEQQISQYPFYLYFIEK